MCTCFLDCTVYRDLCWRRWYPEFNFDVRRVLYEYVGLYAIFYMVPGGGGGLLVRYGDILQSCGLPLSTIGYLFVTLIARVLGSVRLFHIYFSSWPVRHTTKSIPLTSFDIGHTGNEILLYRKLKGACYSPKVENTTSKQPEAPPNILTK